MFSWFISIINTCQKLENEIIVKINLLGVENNISTEELTNILSSGKFKLHSDQGELVLYCKQMSNGIEYKRDDSKVTVSDLEDIARKHGVKMEKRIYRKQDERPHPDLPADDDKNKLQAHFQARISKDLAEKVESLREKTGKTKKQLTEEAFISLLNSYDIDM